MKVYPSSRYTVANGVFPDCFTREGHCTPEKLDENLHRIKVLTGQLPAFAITAAWGFDDPPYRFPFELMEVMDQRGVIPLVILWPYGSGPQGGGCLDPIISGDLDAVFHQRAREVYDWSYGGRRPIMAQFGTEVTFAHYPWAAANNGGWELTGQVDGATWPIGPAKYIHASRRIHRIYAEAGCELTWNWHVLAEFWGNYDNLPARYYPGNDYTDWIGVGLYLDPAGGLWGTYEGGLRDSLDQLWGIGSDKPLYVEVMCQEHPTNPAFKSDYFRDVFNRTFSGEFPRAVRHGGAIGVWDAYTATGEPGIAAAGPQAKYTPGPALSSTVPLRMGIDSSPASVLVYREGVSQAWNTNKVRLV